MQHVMVCSTIQISNTKDRSKSWSSTLSTTQNSTLMSHIKAIKNIYMSREDTQTSQNLCSTTETPRATPHASLEFS